MSARGAIPGPLIGVTTDLASHANGVRVFTYRNYAAGVAGAGGVPVLLPPVVGCVRAFVGGMDGFILTGGDDPATEPFGVPTHPRATRVHAARQAFETELLRVLAIERPDAPVLGVCLGMQMMALVAGGVLEQCMPETCPTHERHWEREHTVEAVGEPAVLLRGVVRSKHRQAVSDAGSMAVTACAPDGVVEAIEDRTRGYYLGVQWHPERTADDAVGAAVFRGLVRACAVQGSG